MSRRHGVTLYGPAVSPSGRPSPFGIFDLIFYSVILSVWLVTGVWALVNGDGWKLSPAVAWVLISGVWLGRIPWSRRRDRRGTAAERSP